MGKDNKRRNDFIDFTQKRTAEQLEDIFFKQQRKAHNRNRLTSTYTGKALRELLKTNRFDYVREKHIKSAHKNAGSVMEYLIARDIKGLPNHIVDNKKGVDIKGRWKFEIKAFTSNSAPHGYRDFEEWQSVFNHKDKFMLFNLDNTVYQINGIKLLEIFHLLKPKNDMKNGKPEMRIASTEKNLKILIQYSRELDTVALY